MNRQKRYTPGPWRLHTRALASVTSEEHAIADCSCWDISSEDTYDEKIANAYLIASAPDLLEALEWAAQQPYAGGKSIGDLEPVKSALAKAYGES